MSDQPDCRTYLLPPSPHDTPRTNEACRADPHGQETRFVPAGFSRQLERELAAAKERIARLEDSLTSIREYWNRDNNDRAMEDACWHAINTASEALDTKEAKP